MQRRQVGRAGGGRGRRAPRGINSRPRFDRRCGDWRCRPPSPRGEGRSARSGRGGGGGLECPGGGGRRPRGRSRAGGEGRGPGAGRGRGPPLLPAPGSVSPPSPRRLGVGGAVRAGGAARGGARCFVSSSPCGVARAAGEAPAPSGRRANGGGGGESAALPAAKATPRSSQATRRAVVPKNCWFIF